MPKMLCWLAFGEHEALNGAMKRVGIFIPAEGKPTIPLRIYPADRRAITSAAFFWEAQVFCWLTFREDEALKRDMKRTRILIPT